MKDNNTVKLTWFAVCHLNRCNSQRPQITLHTQPTNINFNIQTSSAIV